MHQQPGIGTTVEQMRKMEYSCKISFVMIFFLQVTNESFIDGGFFKTGDAGKVDEDGYYIILGRKEIQTLCIVF